jgi:hypothetical protein
MHKLRRRKEFGVLMALAASDPEAQRRVQSFEAALRELGWNPGQNVRID